MTMMGDGCSGYSSITIGGKKRKRTQGAGRRSTSRLTMKTPVPLLSLLLSLVLLLLAPWHGFSGSTTTAAGTAAATATATATAAAPEKQPQRNTATTGMYCERREVGSTSEGSAEAKSTAVFCTFRFEEDRSQKTFRACLDESSGECVTASVYRSKDKASEPKPETSTTTTTTTSTSTTTTTSTSTKIAEETETTTETKSSPAGKESPDTAAHLPDATDRLPKKPRTGPIMVGKAAYNPPYQQQYGQNVGDVLLDFHPSDFDTTAGTDDLVDWYLDLGHAHMDDAEYGVVFDKSVDGNTNYANHPKNYHIQLAIQVYEVATATLLGMTSLDDLLAIDYTKDMEEGDKVKMVRLQYYAVIEYEKGEAYSVAAGGQSSSGFSLYMSPENNDFHAKALECYRRAQASYEKLRYLYAKLSSEVAAAAASGRRTAYEATDDLYFNQERYYLIETYYAHSCVQLGMSLYSQLVLDQNAEVIATNEKVMEMVKSQTGLRADASEDEIVAALMDQANGGMGGGGGGGAGAAAGASSFLFDFDGTPDSIKELSDMLGGSADDSEERDSRLVEITALLDTAILTYEQHAHPSRHQQQQQPPPKDRKGSDGKRKFKLVINGVHQKSASELAEEEHLFQWRASLATAYQSASMIAAYRNQHIRSRELINLSLELYTTSILPYYDEIDLREENAKLRNSGFQSSSSPSSVSAMTRKYAEDSAGQLYVTLAETSKLLGGYEDSINAYSRAMEWHDEQGLSPPPSGDFNSLYEDEVSIHHYKDVVATYHQQLDKYRHDVRRGYSYRDDTYEAQVLMAVAPLYMAMGEAEPAIRYYQESIEIHQRFTKPDDVTSDSNRRNLLTMADVRFGLASAYFHNRNFLQSKKEYLLACRAYLKIHGEGVPPRPEAEAVIEDMKDWIVEKYGEEYYEQLKSSYVDSSSSSSNNNNGAIVMLGGNGVNNGGDNNNNQNNPKLATNFDVQGYHNETAASWDEDEEEDWDEERGATSSSNDEL